MAKDRYVRTCQSCGHTQDAKPINEWKSDKWRDVKCKKCKSPDLDYGCWVVAKVNWELLEDGEDE